VVGCFPSGIFFSQLQIKIHIHRAFIPGLPREKDKIIKNYFCTMRLTAKPTCYIECMQVLPKSHPVSDIATADGMSILSNIKQGIQIGVAHWHGQDNPNPMRKHGNFGGILSADLRTRANYANRLGLGSLPLTNNEGGTNHRIQIYYTKAYAMAPGESINQSKLATRSIATCYQVGSSFPANVTQWNVPRNG